MEGEYCPSCESHVTHHVQGGSGMLSCLGCGSPNYVALNEDDDRYEISGSPVRITPDPVFTGGFA